MKFAQHFYENILHVSIKKRYLDIIKLLLNKDFDINIPRVLEKNQIYKI